MQNSVLFSICLLAVGLLNPATAPLAVAQEFCPCSYSSAVRTRALQGGRAECQVRGIDIGNVPPEGRAKQSEHIRRCAV